MKLRKGILIIYQKKNKGLERFWDFNTELPVERKVMKTREVIKMKNGCENDTLPLYSVLELQVKRSKYLAEKWTDSKFFMNPTEFGWYLSKDEKYEFQLQKESDPYFFLPKHLLLGCQCKNVCSKSCGCKKDPYRLTCALATCKFCSCFDRKPSTSCDMSEESSDNSSDNESLRSEISDSMFENFDFENIDNADSDLDTF